MSLTLTPAYGRDYKSRTAARDDFESGKDFIDASYGAKRPYINRSQIPNGTSVKIRFNGLRDEFSFIAGSKPPIRHATARKPREFVRYHVTFRREAYPDSETGADIVGRIGVGFTSKVKAIREAKKFAEFPHTVRTTVYGEKKSGDRVALAEFKGSVTPTELPALVWNRLKSREGEMYHARGYGGRRYSIENEFDCLRLHEHEGMGDTYRSRLIQEFRYIGFGAIREAKDFAEKWNREQTERGGDES